MSYTKTVWSNDAAPAINADNLNHLETQYDSAMADGAATFAPLSAQRLALMSDTWAGEKAIASGVSRSNYEDATNVNENWANLSSWAYTANYLQVSGGKLFGGASAGGSSGANRSFALGANDKLVLKTTVTIPSGTMPGDVIVGVSKDNAGATPASAAANVVGIDFQASDMSIRPWFLGRDTSSTSLGTFAAGTYYVTITADQTTITVSATQSTLKYAAEAVYVRNGFAINNLYAFVNDSRGTAGSSVGALGATKALTSLRTRTGVEDLAPFWTHVSDNGTYRVGIVLPKSFDSRKPLPMLLAFHGKGSSALGFHTGDNNQTDLMSAFVAAGFMVVSASYSANYATWGSDAGLSAYEYAYQYAKSYFPVGPVAFFGNSMGGIESLLTLARNKIPCSAWIATVPTVSLRNNYTANYGADISTSYGLASDGSDYDTKTAGHDPFLMAPTAFRGVPMMVTIATDDQSVYPAQNWDLLEPLVKPYARDYQRVNVTGGHTSNALGDQAAAFVAFVQRFIGNTLS